MNAVHLIILLGLYLQKVILIPITRGQTLLSSAVLQSKYQRESTRRYSSDKDDISYNLTRHEAVTYLENVLGVPDPVSFVNKNKVAFLQEMIRQTRFNIPFTILMAIRFTEEGIKSPSLEDIKHALFKRQGGHCMAINSFTNAVLQCLGFDTYLIGASIHRWRVPLIDNHTAVIIKHLTDPESLHLVDVGSQHFLPLISLNFDRISQVYPIRSLQHRFFQVSPGVVQLTRKCEPSNPGLVDGLIYAENDEFWEVMTTFRTSAPRYLAECYNLTNNRIQNPKLGAGGMDGIWVYSFPNNLSVSIVDNKCFTVTETGYTEVTKLESTTQVINTILEYFPQYSRYQLEKMADFVAKLRVKSTS